MVRRVNFVAFSNDNTTRAGIIENHARTSWISLFGLGEKNIAKRFSFSGGPRQIKRQIEQALLGEATQTA